jgi:hypothetical protein
MIERELKDGEQIPFIWMTKRYGRAEFVFCLHYLRGKLDKVYITPMQQPDAKEKFILPQYGQETFSANSWTHKGLNDPNIWLHYWCKEHKAPAFNLYVPDGSTHFDVTGNNIHFSVGYAKS